MDDSALVEATLRGNPEAFGSLVRRYQQTLIASARYQTRSMDDAEDLAQETFMDAYKHLASLRDYARFRVWLFGILRNKCRNYLRSRRPEELALDDVIDTLAAPSPADAHDLVEILDTLPLPDREVLTARYLQELSFEEMAGMLGVSEQAVRMRCSRARARARQLVQGQSGTVMDEDETLRRAALALFAIPLHDAFADRVIMEVNAMSHVTHAANASSAALPKGAAMGWKTLALAGGALALAVAVPVVRYFRSHATPPTPVVSQVMPAGERSEQQATTSAPQSGTEMSEEEKLEVCKANAHAIATAVLDWANAHGNRLPDQADWAAQVGIDPKLLVCPARPNEKVGYTILPHLLGQSLDGFNQRPETVPFLTDCILDDTYSPVRGPHDGKMIIAYLDGHLELQGESRSTDAQLRATEATLRGNLQKIRTAVSHFHADTGCLPAELIDITRTKNDAPSHGVDESGNAVAIPRGLYNGPYIIPRPGGIDGLPVNPFVDSTILADHWGYEYGQVWVPLESVTLDGIRYADL